MMTSPHSGRALLAHRVSHPNPSEKDEAVTAKRERDDGQVAVMEPEVTTIERNISGEPRLIVAGGRGKVGKSVLLRAAIERSIERGGDPIIADADRTNATLRSFYPQAIRPPSAEDGDVRDWLNKLVDDQIAKRQTIFLDLGGGDLSLHAWARDLDLVPFLLANGITPVLLHCLGSDIDDLAYLRDLEAVFAPPHTAIVLNEGMVPAGRAPLTAFEPLIEHAVFRAAAARGAVTVRLPRLGCMQRIERARVTFREMEQGRVPTGDEAIGPTTKQMVTIWLRQIEQTLSPIWPWLA
jgi:hypothetical protein